MISLDKKTLLEILQKRFSEGFLKLSDIPHPKTMKNVSKAALRIAKAIEKKEKIAIVGDYDVDGVVSSALMWDFFAYIGYPVTVKIPNRFKEGYGVTKELIENLDAELVITVDNGINAIDAAEFCKEKGIDLIITDHHTPGPLIPDAYAVVNPKQEGCSFAYKEICGAQVVWLLIGQIKSVLALDIDMKRYLDILSLAVIADVMPLRHINRPIVAAGLNFLSKSERECVKALRLFLGKESFSAEDIGYIVAPLINSAGRMDDASVALDFLLSKSAEEAGERLSLLSYFNSQRKKIETEVFNEASKTVEDKESVIIAAGKEWHEGVVGIVASRLAQSFKKPAIVLSQNGDLLKGSGRSYANIDLFSIINSAKEHLLKFGGHKKAAGLSLEVKNFPDFRNSIAKASENIPSEWLIEENSILGELSFRFIDWETMQILDRFAPYGESNPLPKFFCSDVEILDAKLVGEEKNHLSLYLQKDGKRFRAIKFRHNKLPENEKADIIFTLQKNYYNGIKSIHINIDNII
ncbi:single-stranded-DNA-specific exonuclease RecJ [Nitrosophilus alvini]|uniref:single-stranded-DNA-specific exonuclease RecJ n=1 Tax=Nitrosophilus alvini TaxID=2714855 RepID=UPI00190A195A|nr:single-stranded-DNA-specific exonuclease RecJ [Nitrosophilus alvini]